MQAGPEWAKQAAVVVSAPGAADAAASKILGLPEVVARLRQSLGLSDSDILPLFWKRMACANPSRRARWTYKGKQSLQLQSSFSLLEFKASATGQPTNDNSCLRRHAAQQSQ